MFHKGASFRRDQNVCNSTDVISQQDSAHSLSQLELQCGQSLRQMESLSVCQAPQSTNRLIALQQQPISNNSNILYHTADLENRQYAGIAQTNRKGLEPSAPARTCILPTAAFPSTQPVSSGSDARDANYHDIPSIVGNSESRYGAQNESAQNEVELGYKRVDSVWDGKSFAFKLRTTAKAAVETQHEDYPFRVRRTFDGDGKYQGSFVDIKSPLLRECLQDVIGTVRGVNLVQEIAKVDPNLLFLYLEDLRSHLRKLKVVELVGQCEQDRRRNQDRLDEKREELTLLIKYLDQDYEKMKGSLYPMLENGIISFEYLWALWKPDTLMYSAKYSQKEDARVFKVNIATRYNTIFQGNYYTVEGKYLDFDGKHFGLGNVTEDIPEFQGTLEITSLPFYPLSYHKDQSKVRQTLIERGKKFVSLSGASLKEYFGIAYVKAKRGALTKLHIEKSRIMVDSAIFKRTNPNYFVSIVSSRDPDGSTESLSSNDEDGGIGFDSKNVIDLEKRMQQATMTTKATVCNVLITKALQADLDAESKSSLLLPSPTTSSTTGQEVNSSESSTEERVADTLKGDSIIDRCSALTDDEYLLASPVVLGFSFSEKRWLEFSVSRVSEVKWNEEAWTSLVLPPETKELIQALVKSRLNNVRRTTDDIIQGKGKGLISVLHGPPGTGKTLTAEGISELLQRPLYMVSAGELGTSPGDVESELKRILSLCRSWGAILLLDEADVFLEKRNIQDVYRNALVSIFLRQLEYFQGILFLTTNRVETFDEAFRSRIHIAIRYEGLDSTAKKAIFQLFVDRVKAHGKLSVEPFFDEDFTQLAKHDLNGREIKNVIGSAQDLALNKDEALSMRHIQQVLDIHVKFGRDLRGGTGYEEAMRSYC
ncbi:hypothetical protein E4U21_001285 [Claviceps maximensis]|nr:hypothetical protein E4U21_001285 [Claviceps maximensis]